MKACSKPWMVSIPVAVPDPAAIAHRVALTFRVGRAGAAGPSPIPARCSASCRTSIRRSGLLRGSCLGARGVQRRIQLRHLRIKGRRAAQYLLDAVHQALRPGGPVGMAVPEPLGQQQHQRAGVV